MATSFATASTVVGLGSSLSSKRTCLSSDFVKPVMVRNPLRQAKASGGRFTCMSFQSDWLRRDLNVIGFGLIGWLVPSSVPAIDGKSLTGLFFESIGAELAHFPHTSSSHFPVLVVVDLLALGAFHHPYFWADWLQGKD